MHEETKFRVLSKSDLITDLRARVNEGAEISWFTTDKQSFEWSEINDDVSKFIGKIWVLDFTKADVGFFNPKKKETIYEAYKLTQEAKCN